MARVANTSDIESIARSQALEAGRKLLGITASKPQYVLMPDETDPAAVSEFVVDVHLLDGPSQAVVLGAPGGLRLVRNVLIASSAVGDLIAGLHTPVEIEKVVTGQLQVVARAKVSLPTLRLDQYSYSDLQLEHLSQFERDEDGVLRDAFGYPVAATQGGAAFGPRISVSSRVVTRLSKASELNKDDQGNTILLGVNTATRTIIDTRREWEVIADESVAVSETSDSV